MGGRFCKSHGGNLPNLRREANENRARAEVLAREARNPLAVRERRHPTLVLLDAVHTLDVLHDVAKRSLDSGADGLTPEDWLKLTNAAERAARAAKMVFEARADQALAVHTAAETDVIVRVLNAALAALDLDPEREAVARRALRRELERVATESRARSGGPPAIGAGSAAP
jgi:hypothetical protein